MQQPTCTGLKIRTPHDAHVIFHAVAQKKLPMIQRRLDAEERRCLISSGCVFVWEEKTPGSHSESGIERWTDSVRWGPSRCRDEFLFYHEKDDDGLDLEGCDSDRTPPAIDYGRRFFRENLIKQTYSVFVSTSTGRRKWHLIAYFTQESVDFLKTIEDFPFLSRVKVPHGLYKSGRSPKGRGARDPKSQTLAPLVYLQSHPPSRRHPVDEETLMSLSSWKGFLD